MNPCKLTECQGKPRCAHCAVMDAAYGPPQRISATERDELIAVAEYLQFDGSMSEDSALRRAALLRRIAGVGGRDGD